MMSFDREGAVSAIPMLERDINASMTT